MITDKKGEYLAIKKLDPNADIEYVPDSRYISWYPNRNRLAESSQRSDTKGKLKMSVILDDDADRSKIPPLLSLYDITYYKEEDISDNLRDIIENSDLIICQSYNVHMATIILERPFISYKPNSEVKGLLKDIGIKHHKDINLYINSWPKHMKHIEKYNKLSYNRLLKLNG